jgi:hypothetical protein
MAQPATDSRQSNRESFDNIYLDLSKESGKCRFAETGFGWKPSGGGDTFTLDHSNIGGAQWSRASKGYEVKILLRNSGIVQLDGFSQEVSHLEVTFHCKGTKANGRRTLSASARSSRTGTVRISNTRNMRFVDGIGAKASSERQN